MGSWKEVLTNAVCSGVLVSSTVLPLVSQQAPTAQSTAPVSVAANPGNPETIEELPDSPGATAVKSFATAQARNISEHILEQRSADAAVMIAAAQVQQPPASPPSSQTSQAPAQRPVGTAAAEAPNASGIAASQPAGVAIAPAKQRRVRTIVLRMGALIGAGVAVGSVVALTSATSSKPPGAH